MIAVLFLGPSVMLGDVEELWQRRTAIENLNI